MKKRSKMDIFITLVRPGSLLAMVALLVLGGFIFAITEFFSPGSGARAMEVFVGYFDAMSEEYYDTIQVMFTTYVIGRSGQAIAKDFAAVSIEKVKAKAAEDA